MSKRGVVTSVVGVCLLVAAAYGWAYAPKDAPELSKVQVEVSGGTTYAFTVTWSTDAGKPREVHILIGNWDAMPTYTERLTHAEIVAGHATVVCKAPTEGAPWAVSLSSNRGISNTIEGVGEASL